MFDKIVIEGVETTVMGVDLFQKEAPHFWAVTDSAGTALIVERRGKVWGVQGKPTFLAKVHIPKPEKTAREINRLFQPAKPIGVAAVEAIKLSTEVMALHEQLDRLRDKHGRADDPSATTWPAYEQAILAVDLADPGFYLGRVLPIARLPRHIMPDLDYDGIRARMTFSEIPANPETTEEGMAPILFTEGTCRVCGCTEYDCTQCIAKTGKPCHWVDADLCSACVVSQK